ncbi:hypothetical protein ILYODFUR_032132 [Ilyodon furcidens]|uniref:SEA domain-containing protein n=1 Tax=Ilyodon furcidens TaxID=33524 RepID=A0ABV0SQW8_9TELE
MTKSEGVAEQKTERQTASSCCSWRRLMLGLLPFFPFTAAITLALNYLTSPACSVFFLGGSVEFPNLSFSLELTDPTSLQFRLQAQALDHYFSKLYESTPWSSYYQHSGITAFGEGEEGLSVFYWSKFSAPRNVALEIQSSSPERLQRRLPGTNKVLRYSRNEQRYYMEEEDDTLHLLDLDSDDSESEDRTDKMKNPNNIQGGKWQLGFQESQEPASAAEDQTAKVSAFRSPSIPHCTQPISPLPRVVSPLEGGPTFLLRAVPGRAPWVKARPPGARQRAPPTGLAPEWGLSHPRPGEGTVSIYGKMEK